MTSAAFGADLDRVPSAPQPAGEAEPHIEFFSGGDATTRRIWSNYYEVTGALTGSLDQSGVRIRGAYGFAGYDYPARAGDIVFPPFPGQIFGDLPDWVEVGKIRGAEQGGALLLGYEFVTERWSLLGMVGAEILHDHLSRFDPTNLVQGTAWGFKVAAELDARPTAQTMLYAHGSYSTAFETAYVDVRPGWLLADKLSIAGVSGKVYVGPQGAFYSDYHDQISKVGAHLTFTDFGPFHVTVGAGYDHDRYNGPGLYGLLETSTRF